MLHADRSTRTDGNGAVSIASEDMPAKDVARPSGELLLSRIAPLYDVGPVRKRKVLIAGLGAGGSQVAHQLAMCGVDWFSLRDFGKLGIENVIRHICGLRHLDEQEVDCVAEVLLDRNPRLSIERHYEDLMTASDLADDIQSSTVVVVATDNDATR